MKKPRKYVRSGKFAKKTVSVSWDAEPRYTLATEVKGVNDKVIDPYENQRLRDQNAKLLVEVECMRRLILDALRGCK
jgi:hypothetical protein